MLSKNQGTAVNVVLKTNKQNKMTYSQTHIQKIKDKNTKNDHEMDKYLANPKDYYKKWITR